MKIENTRFVQDYPRFFLCSICGSKMERTLCVMVLQNFLFGRCWLRLVFFCKVGGHVEAPSQCDVDGRGSIQGSSPETRCFLSYS